MARQLGAGISFSAFTGGDIYIPLLCKRLQKLNSLRSPVQLRTEKLKEKSAADRGPKGRETETELQKSPQPYRRLTGDIMA